MDLLLRIGLYLLVTFLITIVYVGQQHDNARDILKASAAKTGRFMAWTLVLVVVMQLCFALFID